MPKNIHFVFPFIVSYFLTNHETILNCLFKTYMHMNLSISVQHQNRHFLSTKFSQKCDCCHRNRYFFTLYCHREDINFCEMRHTICKIKPFTDTYLRWLWHLTFCVKIYDNTEQKQYKMTNTKHRIAFTMYTLTHLFRLNFTEQVQLFGIFYGLYKNG